MKKALASAFVLILFVTALSAARARIAYADDIPRYRLDVDRVNQLTYVYELQDDGMYWLMDVWASSTGMPGNSTPLGTYTLRPLNWFANSGEFYYFKSWPCWVIYCTQISGNICFHGPPLNTLNSYNISLSGIQEMMYARSHGCVRIWPRQAAFIWFNMAGCKVKIFADEVTDTNKYLRELLLKEVPATNVGYPDPVVTEATKYLYTYHGDTLEKIIRLTGLTEERLVELNPGFDFTGDIGPGHAILINPDAWRPIYYLEAPTPAPPTPTPAPTETPAPAGTAAPSAAPTASPNSSATPSQTPSPTASAMPKPTATPPPAEPPATVFAAVFTFLQRFIVSNP